MTLFAPVVKPVKHIDYSNDIEVAFESFRQACRGAASVGIKINGDFVYTGKNQQITIRVRNIDGTDDSAK